MGRHPRRAPLTVSVSRRFLVATVTAVSAAVATALLLVAIRGGGWPASLDAPVTRTVTGARGGLLAFLAEAVTFVGSTIGLAALTAVVAAWLGWRVSRWRAALALVLTMVGADLLTRTLKGWVGRPRPPVAVMVPPPATDPAFPSGHTTSSTVFFGAVALLVVLGVLPSPRPRLAVGLCAAAVTLVGFSRVVLGYHWMTDVVGGWVIGMGYLALVWLAADTVRRLLPGVPAVPH